MTEMLPTTKPALFDVTRYVEEFTDDILPAYAAGYGSARLPADLGVARSIVPPGTAAGRDFSGLAPQIPQFVAEHCVGCMACVSICPDSALFAVATPTSALDAALTEYAGRACPEAVEGARAHFVDTKKYGDVPARKGLEPAKFGIFVDPVHCKGCAECVTVCKAEGHDALVMIDKQPANGVPSTVDQFKADLAFYRSLGPTPVAYRNEKALADLMLGEDAFGYVGGAGSCSGCGEGTSLRMLVAATRQVYGPQGMGMVAATGCNSVFGATYPFNPYLIPWTNSLFENAPADAMGIRARWDQEGHPERRIWAVGGDGAMYDIGFQPLSRMVASGLDVKAFVLDTQVYSNTGGQSSTASFGGQVTKLSAFGKAEHGRVEPRKELGRILMAHGNAYVAQTTPAHLNHFYRAIMDANSFPGPAVVVVYAPCMPEHGIPDDAGATQAKAAVDSRAFPLFTYDPRRGSSLAERLSLQGNPSVKEDWSKLPDGTIYDFVSFARTEGRFAPHFAADGTASVEIQATRDERLANWQLLQEMAGIR